MSVTTPIPGLVARDGGIPTPDELELLWTALADLDEEVVSPLIDRTCAALIAAYEQPHGDPSARIDVDAELVSQWLYWSEHIEGTCETLLEKARRLQALTVSLNHALRHAITGEVDEEPPFRNSHGLDYEPSREALERWGLSDVR
jgi:hypothetical protein